MLVDVAILTLLGVCHDASCHGTCYLSAQDVDTIGSCYDYVGVLILFACLGQPSLVEVAVVMSYELDASVYGEPVGVYIEQTHENAHHNAALVEVGVFVHLFNHYYATVGRSHYYLLGVFAWEESDGASEEVDYNSVDYSEYYSEAPERSFVVAEAPQQQSDSCNEYESVYESVGSFTV